MIEGSTRSGVRGKSADNGTHLRNSGLVTTLSKAAAHSLLRPPRTELGTTSERVVIVEGMPVGLTGVLPPEGMAEELPGVLAGRGEMPSVLLVGRFGIDGRANPKLAPASMVKIILFTFIISLKDYRVFFV